MGDRNNFIRRLPASRAQRERIRPKDPNIHRCSRIQRGGGSMMPIGDDQVITIASHIDRLKGIILLHPAVRAFA